MFYLRINFVLARSDFLLSVSNNIGEKEKQFAGGLFIQANTCYCYFGEEISKLFNL